MSATTKTTKQTAANNAFLRDARKLFNDPIYKGLLAIMNAEGQDACEVYLRAHGLPTDPASALASIGR